jgi:hypothetical protein
MKVDLSDKTKFCTAYRGFIPQKEAQFGSSSHTNEGGGTSISSWGMYSQHPNPKKEKMIKTRIYLNFMVKVL